MDSFEVIPTGMAKVGKVTEMRVMPTPKIMLDVKGPPVFLLIEKTSCPMNETL
jgi:hypothetical protein